MWSANVPQERSAVPEGLDGFKGVHSLRKSLHRRLNKQKGSSDRLTTVEKYEGIAALN